MEKINNRKFSITKEDLIKTGGKVEVFLKALENHEYGEFSTEEMSMENVVVLRIIEGMKEWQWETNRGIKLQGDSGKVLEIYDVDAVQKRVDEAMIKWGTIRNDEAKKEGEGFLVEKYHG